MKNRTWELGEDGDDDEPFDFGDDFSSSLGTPDGEEED
jgi:hypothetical protein